MKFIGAPIKRLEDPRLLVGGGRYVDDLARPGMVHAVIVRSPHAHARVVRVDARRALAQKGVLACVTGADLGGVPPIPIRQGAKPAHAAYLQPPLAGDRVRYVGEPVAVVVATDRASAVDARELVEVQYDVLPPFVDVETLEDHGAPTLFPEGNVADSWTTALGDVDASLREATCVVRERFALGRQTAAPMETRGLLAEWDAALELLTVWGTTKVPYFNRRTLAALLSLEEGAFTSRRLTPAAGSAHAASSTPRTSWCLTWPGACVAPSSGWRIGASTSLRSITHESSDGPSWPAPTSGDGSWRSMPLW